MNAEKKLSEQAFADLRELQRHAEQVVKVAAQFAQELEKRRGSRSMAEGGGSAASGAAAGTDAETAHEADELGSFVLNLGIMNPVTRAAAGNLYHQEVARQLSTVFRYAKM